MTTAPRPPRKTTPRAATKTAEEPTATPDVTINLDTLERETGPRPPFTFLHQGKVYGLVDPDEMDWQDLLIASRNPTYMFAKGLTADSDGFFATQMPTWKMNALQAKYLEHFGLPTPGERNALPR